MTVAVNWLMGGHQTGGHRKLTVKWSGRSGRKRGKRRAKSTSDRRISWRHRAAVKCRRPGALDADFTPRHLPLHPPPHLMLCVNHKEMGRPAPGRWHRCGGRWNMAAAENEIAARIEKGERGNYFHLILFLSLSLSHFFLFQTTIEKPDRRK